MNSIHESPKDKDRGSLDFEFDQKVRIQKMSTIGVS